jgi:hypothetical protein
MNHASRRLVLLAIAACVAGSGCRIYPDAPDDPRDFDAAAVAGFYPIYQIDGNPIGWYHQLAGVNCQVAFITGGLEVAPDKSFHLRLDYNFRCPENIIPDGSDDLSIFGSVITFQDNVYRLRGSGPNLIVPERGFDTWFLEVRPTGEFVSLRFGDPYGDFFAHPELTLGPRASEPPSSAIVRQRQP